nr:hypothetical protein [Tanacetum cinerariifolium]
MKKIVQATSKFQSLLKIGMLVCGKGSEKARHSARRGLHITKQANASSLDVACERKPRKGQNRIKTGQKGKRGEAEKSLK